MSDILGIVGSVSDPSKTKAATGVALHAASNAHNIQTEILHLAEYDNVTADGRKLKDYKGDTKEALNKIINAKSYIIGTPVYRGAYSGLLKNLFDMIPRGMWQADVAPLENSAVGLIATGGSNHHYLSVSQELGPILDFFGSYPVGSGIYAHSGHFDNYQVSDNKIEDRLRTLGKATWELASAIRQSTSLNKLGPQF